MGLCDFPDCIILSPNMDSPWQNDSSDTQVAMGFLTMTRGKRLGWTRRLTLGNLWSELTHLLPCWSYLILQPSKDAFSDYISSLFCQATRSCWLRRESL